MAKKPLPSPELLRQLLRYEPETGKLFWRKRTPSHFKDNGHSAAHNCAAWAVRYEGKEAFGSKDADGYYKGSVFGKDIKAHRVIWALVHGEWPKAIDHINGIREDNSLCNLRNVDRFQNMKNTKRPVTNTSGFVGVCKSRTPGKWTARIRVDRKDIHIGEYDTFKGACEARKEAEVKHGFHPNHGRH